MSASMTARRTASSRHLCKRILHRYRNIFRNLSSDRNEYDLVVIGGGSGGLACSKRAAELGKKVAVLDYVKPSTQGTSWGLGGTCVNVGCIPKKLMHHAALLGHAIEDSKAYGWNVPGGASVDWSSMTEGVQGYIKSMNWGHRVELHNKNVEYINALGSLSDKHTVRAVDGNNKERLLSTENIVVSVGGRPSIPKEIPGAAEHCISSDDLFWLKKAPGKTLVIGGSYIALECGGFLSSMGFDTTVMVRSICLRNFDQQMSKLVTDYMENNHTRFLWKCLPQKITRQDSGKLIVTYSDVDGSLYEEEFDTVMFATGRKAVTESLNLREAGVAMDTDTGKMFGGHGGDHERSSVSNIYGIGDVLHGQPELTPVAIKAGKLLANRLFSDREEQMDYNLIPTTVFTPLEYAVVGISEERAVEIHGEDNIEVYHAFYRPLEFCVPGRDASQCYIKAVCTQAGKVLGLHLTGPNAGEILQGFAVAIRCGATFDQITSSIGIHPTSAEEVVKMHITKRSGQDPHVTGC